MSKRSIGWGAAFALVAIAASGTLPAQTTGAQTTGAQMTGAQTTRAQTRGASAATTLAEAGQAELVQPFDTLEVSVLQLESLNRAVEVNSVGVISLPLAGDFLVSGRTTAQVAKDIANRLGEHDLQNPQVTVTLKDASQNTVSLKDTARRGFTVEGSVAQPGVYAIYGPTTLLQGLAMAKGIDQYANEKKVTVFRPIEGVNRSYLFNLNDIRDGKIPDPEIYPKDTIVVATSKTRRFVRDFAPLTPLVYLVPKL